MLEGKAKAVADTKTATFEVQGSPETPALRSISPSGPYSVDASKAVFLEGSLTCIAAGVEVKVMGTATAKAGGGALILASQVAAKGCSGERRSAAGG